MREVTRRTRSSRRSSSGRRSTRTTTAPRRATSSGSSRQGDKVKVTIMFRGREQSRPELGFRLLQRLAEDVEELGFVESRPKQDGRNMIMVIGPHKKKSEAKAERAPRGRSARDGSRRAGATRPDAAPRLRHDPAHRAGSPRDEVKPTARLRTSRADAADRGVAAMHRHRGARNRGRRRRPCRR